jgi:hypothetical protein
VPPNLRTSLDAKGVECRMIGYPKGYKDCYQVLIPKINKILIRHDCVWFEDPTAGIAPTIDPVDPKYAEAINKVFGNNNKDVDQVINSSYNISKIMEQVGEDILDLPPIPRTIDEAIQPGPYANYWRKAIDDEFDEILGRQTFRLQQSSNYNPLIDKLIKSKYVFRVTRQDDGSLKFKFRFVACGYSQIEGYNYFDTFAPTAKSQSIHAVAHIAATEDWEISIGDVGNAYLESQLDAPVFMKLPIDVVQYFISKGYDKVEIVELLLALYGLKQSGNLWNKKIHSILIEDQFTQHTHDKCVYYKLTEAANMIIVLVHVDDIFATSKEQKDIDNCFNHINSKVKKLKVKNDIGIDKSSIFLGIQIRRDREAKQIHLSQSDYAIQVVKTYGKNLDLKPQSTP